MDYNHWFHQSWPSSNDSTNRVIQCHIIQPMQPTILDFSEIAASVSTQNEFTKWKFSVQCSLLFWIYDLLRMLPLHLYLVGIFSECLVKTSWKVASYQILGCWIWWLKEKNMNKNCAFLYLCKIYQFQKLIEIVSY